MLEKLLGEKKVLLYYFIYNGVANNFGLAKPRHSIGSSMPLDL